MDIEYKDFQHDLQDENGRYVFGLKYYCEYINDELNNNSDEKLSEGLSEEMLEYTKQKAKKMELGIIENTKPTEDP